MLSFYGETQLQIFFRFISTCRKRHVEAADRQHSSLSAFAPFSGALLCNRTARALLHPLPTEQRLPAERLPRPYNAVRADRPKLASIRFPQS